jgi:hypothetical protein
MRLVLAMLLAYIPSAASLLKHAAQRAQALGRTREVTLSGNLTLGGDPQRPAQLLLRFPLQCRLEGEGGLSVAVKATPENPAGAAEGPSGPALRLVQLACPLLAYRSPRAEESPDTLRLAAQSAGADVGAGAGLSRLADRVTYVLGATPRDPSSPQLWLYKDNSAPARLIAQGGADLRLLQYGSPAAAEWFPRVIELWTSGQLAARFEVLEAKGVRGSAHEEEPDSPD